MGVLNRFGTTDLHVAAGAGDVRSLEILLEEGRDPNVQNYIGFTPLHTAVINGEVSPIIKKIVFEYLDSLTFEF